MDEFIEVHLPASLSNCLKCIWNWKVCWISQLFNYKKYKRSLVKNGVQKICKSQEKIVLLYKFWHNAQKNNKPIWKLQKNGNVFSTIKSLSFSEKATYTRSYTHYPQKKVKNNQDFMVTEGTSVLYKNYKIEKKGKNEWKKLDFLSVKKI